MSQGNYAKGRNFEYETRDHLRLMGYEVIRSAGSKTKVDLVAIKPGQILLVQCKLPGSPVSREAWNMLVTLAARGGALPILAKKVPGKKVPEYRRLVGPLLPRERQEAATVAWFPDEVAQCSTRS